MQGLMPFLQVQFNQMLWRKRWLLPLPLLGFIAYRCTNAIQVSSRFNPLAPNAWDLLFTAFGNRFNVYLAIGLLFLYLVCDLLPEGALGQQVLLRLGSRKTWWLGKVLTLLGLTLVYVFGSAGLLAIMASLAFPWQAGYSAAAMANPDQVGLPMSFFRAIQPGPPWQVLGAYLLLLILGLFCLGLLMMVVTQLTRRYFFGLLAGCLALASGYIGLFLSAPPVWSLILMSEHFTYMGQFPLRNVPLGYSILYWAVWIALLAAGGLLISRRQDHLANPEGS